jgi:glycosyltransferase involved in cell wall biosynthesis
VDYSELVDWIHRADICLGIFGDSEKAARVIPNKVFQILSTGTPLITRDSPAIRELLDPEMPGVLLVPPKQPDALVDALHSFMCQQHQLAGSILHREVVRGIQPLSIGKTFIQLLNRLSTPAWSP